MTTTTPDERRHPVPAALMPTMRRAVPEDAPAIAALKRASVRAIFPRCYDAEQTAAAVVHLTSPDHLLIADGTYVVQEAGEEIVACGGWSRRALLYPGSPEDGDRVLDPRAERARVRAMFVRSDWTRRGLGRAMLDHCLHDAAGAGFRALALMATLPGVPLYTAYGFTEIERVGVALPEGPTLECVLMHRATGRR
ncbi:GNAT family N-acetyltransferase [Modestobacter marinus]|uniref:Acetyltransferase n=1 Tax=Modestobacter marinus TaxID=477641 RepID=A0A846LRR2_9ACTN|nr:GNAT family N-acetyltransferase [Modestobacter marinus]NIH68972.1 GNAT superfamily N-acetyltransferase [Modestobacter marinus]GGL78545.1 acetyltransferase [Modestobacter marinus]